MDSHFVTLALHIGRLPPLHPPSCHRRAPFSLLQNVSNLEASNVSYPRVVAVLAVAIVARNMLQLWISSLRSVTGYGPEPRVDYHAPSVNSYVAAVEAPDGVANQVWLGW